MNIKHLHKVEMPREKLEKYGAEKLFDYELLALILGSGIKGVNVLELSKKVLKIVKETGTKRVSQEQLQSIKGLGKAKACLVSALLELSKRLTVSNTVEILSTEDIWKLCADIRNSKKEHFVAFYLDTQNFLIERQIISIGTLNASLVHPREVFEPGISLHAASIIVAHNHPSGKTEASSEDRWLTKCLVDAGKLLGIEVIDHIVVTSYSYKSILK